MRRLLLIIMAATIAIHASAQELYDDYRLYKIANEEQEEMIISSDTLLFYRLQQSPYDLYEDASAYRFSFVEFGRRGQFYMDRKALLDGVEVRHQNLSVLRRLGVAEQSFSGLSFGAWQMAGGHTGMDLYSTHEATPIDGLNVGLFFSGRGYLGGVRATAHAALGAGWSTSIHTAAKGGDDIYIKGVYNNALDLAFRMGKQYESGANLSLVAIAALSDRGLRSGSTKEAFNLRGDKLYNPTWGKQSGKVRNSRTRQDSMPFVMLSYLQPLSPSTQLSLSIGGDYGIRKYGTLGWYDAMTPRPDNYRYLPSYYGSETIAAEVEKAWRQGDENYTQVNWNEIYNQNRMSSSGAVYALESRAERVARGEAVLNFRSEISQHLMLNYGTRISLHNSRNYKQMESLLGALYLRDVDYYLMDDDTFASNHQNDLRNPDRKVGEGDRFAYDYSLSDNKITFVASINYRSDRWLWDVGLSVGSERFARRGYFEKEIYSGADSYGRSAVVKFTPYKFKTRLGYSFSAKHFADIAVALSDEAPSPENLFHNPQYNNRVADNPDAEHHFSAEANYRYSSPDVKFVLTAYLISKRNQRQIFRAYDDLTATYCDVDVAGLGQLFYGVESAGSFRLSRNLELSYTAAAGEFTYSENPVVTHYDDRNGSVVSRSLSYMGGCHVGGAPQLSASAQITYFTYRGWIASCGVQVVAMRYVDPSVIRRTERVAHQASLSPEIYNSFITQGRLSDSVTLDASLSRWFNVGRARWSVTLSAKNLLGNRNIEYSGYEQSRIRNYQSGATRVYMPMDDVVMYAYPRTFYAVISCKL